MKNVRIFGLFFGLNDKLWKIVTISKGFENDPRGIIAKDKFKQLENLFIKEYQVVERFHHVQKGYSGKSFTMGIKHGENWYFTKFKKGDISILFSLVSVGNSTDTSGYVLIHTNTNLEKNIENSNRK